MPTCFVIQPFDRAAFDQRFDEVLVPAIRDAGMDPYRVDRDASVIIPIEQIEDGIRRADACVADISTNNPNVWFELGYAIAAGKPVLLIALDDPTRKFPFDVQHRHVVLYRTNSPGDFDKLRMDLTARLRSSLQRHEHIENLAASKPGLTVGGLTQHEVAAVVAIAERTEDEGSWIDLTVIRQAMENAGFTRIAVGIALQSLLGKKMLEHAKVADEQGDPVHIYKLTVAGSGWLLNHQNTLALRQTAG
jgi:nucleoside 2-deoxyribosyltransferase